MKVTESTQKMYNHLPNRHYNLIYEDSNKGGLETTTERRKLK